MRPILSIIAVVLKIVYWTLRIVIIPLYALMMLVGMIWIFSDVYLRNEEFDYIYISCFLIPAFLLASILPKTSNNTKVFFRIATAFVITTYFMLSYWELHKVKSIADDFRSADSVVVNYLYHADNKITEVRKSIPKAQIPVLASMLETMKPQLNIWATIGQMIGGRTVCCCLPQGDFTVYKGDSHSTFYCMYERILVGPHWFAIIEVDPRVLDAVFAHLSQTEKAMPPLPEAKPDKHPDPP